MQSIHEELSWRGLIHQSTDEEHLAQWLVEQPRTIYAGFDPTADSLHVGHLMAVMILRRFQAFGHRPIALVGGATGMIGDPSGKSAERNLLGIDELRANVESIKGQLARFLDFDAGALLVNNYDWMSEWSYLEFLRDIGKNFPVNVMLAKDSVKSRLERDDAGLSYTEFSYMLLQAYDFVRLHEMHGCNLQVGGSDQWGNITAGIDLARRMGFGQVYGITCPLLTKSDGGKMGKTESGAVWLDPARTSPYAFYQYWINVSDDDVGKCLRFLTEIPRDEVEQLDQARAEAPHEKAGQKRLAEWLTQLVHGDEGLAKARRATEIFFGADIADLSDAELGEIFADVPSREVPRAELAAAQLTIVDALALTQLAKSKAEARRKVAEGGAYLNNHRVTDANQPLTAADLASETVMVVRVGKKKYALLKFV
ncbi:MAG: tyrosine--tRNA ligase [Pirellulales bacterium]